MVARLFERIFAAARTALNAAETPLNSKGYWSFAALDAIDISNYMPFKRVGMIKPAPHTTMQLHGCENDGLTCLHAFMSYGKSGYIVDTTKFKKTAGPSSPSQLRQV